MKLREIKRKISYDTIWNDSTLKFVDTKWTIIIYRIIGENKKQIRVYKKINDNEQILVNIWTKFFCKVCNQSVISDYENGEEPCNIFCDTRRRINEVTIDENEKDI